MKGLAISGWTLTPFFVRLIARCCPGIDRAPRQHAQVPFAVNERGVEAENAKQFANKP
jgi:hypothetical protein